MADGRRGLFAGGTIRHAALCRKDPDQGCGAVDLGFQAVQDGFFGGAGKIGVAKFEAWRQRGCRERPLLVRRKLGTVDEARWRSNERESEDKGPFDFLTSSKSRQRLLVQMLGKREKVHSRPAGELAGLDPAPRGAREDDGCSVEDLLDPARGFKDQGTADCGSGSVGV